MFELYHVLFTYHLFQQFLFTFDKISSQDADFGLPDSGAISIDSSPESNFFIYLRAMS